MPVAETLHVTSCYTSCESCTTSSNLIVFPNSPSSFIGTKDNQRQYDNTILTGPPWQSPRDLFEQKAVLIASMARPLPKARSQAQARAQDRVLAITTGAGKSSSRNGRNGESVANVYQELLSEAAENDTSDDRPRKRRRVAQSRAQPVADDATHGHDVDGIDTGGPVSHAAAAQSQTITDSEESDESDIDWEQIGFDQPSRDAADGKEAGPEIEDVSVEVGEKQTPKRTAASKRKPATTAEKLLRVAVHKSHVLLIIFHVHVRNAWCSSHAVEVSRRLVR